MGGRSAGGRGSARLGGGRARAREGLAAREPVVGRTVRPDPVSALGHRHPPESALRLERALVRAAADAAACRHAGDRAPLRLEGRRVDRPLQARRRNGAQSRDRPSHSRRERLRRGSVGGDREGDPGLPRQGKRLERHRLQLPRRPVRQGLRGSRRRDRQERRRRARGGLQHRLRRSRGARRIRLARRGRRGARLACPPARLAARRGSRRPALDPLVRLERQPALPLGPPRLPASGLRPPRHGLHRLSGHRALQPAERARGQRSARSGCRSSTRRS